MESSLRLEASINIFAFLWIFWVCVRYQNFHRPWGMLDIRASNSTRIFYRARNKVKIRSSMALLNSFEITMSLSFPLWDSCSHSFNKRNPPTCTNLSRQSCLTVAVITAARVVLDATSFSFLELLLRETYYHLSTMPIFLKMPPSIDNSDLVVAWLQNCSLEKVTDTMYYLQSPLSTHCSKEIDENPI